MSASQVDRSLDLRPSNGRRPLEGPDRFGQLRPPVDEGPYLVAALDRAQTRNAAAYAEPRQEAPLHPRAVVVPA